MEFFKATQYVNYEVSNYGNVRNTKTGRVLTKSLSRSNGYYKVCLSVNGKPLPIEVHRLVAQTFKPNTTGEKLVVDHIDENKLNNHESNLQWITQKQNIAKASKKNINPAFTKEQIDEIKMAYSTGQYSLIGLTIFFNEKYNRTSTRKTYTKIVK